MFVAESRLAEKESRLAEKGCRLAEKGSRLAEKGSRLAEKESRLAEKGSGYSILCFCCLERVGFFIKSLSSILSATSF